MGYKRFINEVRNLSTKGKRERIFDLIYQVEGVLSEVDPPEFKIYFETILANAVASTFLVNKNSGIGDAEYSLYKDVWFRYKPNYELVEKETFKMLKETGHELLQTLTDNAFMMIKQLVEAYDEASFTDLCCNLFISVSSLDGFVDSNEIDFICDMLGIEQDKNYDDFEKENQFEIIMNDFKVIIENYFIPTAKNQYELSEHIRAILRSLVVVMIVSGRTELSRNKYNFFLEMFEKYKEYIDENAVDHRNAPIYHIESYEHLGSMLANEQAQDLFSYEKVPLSIELISIIDAVQGDDRKLELEGLLDKLVMNFILIDGDITEIERETHKFLTIYDD